MPQDQFSKEKRSWIMSRIKDKDTGPEVKLRHALWHRGLRYRANVTKLPGKPDIVFTRARVTVFVDGDFWHGKKLSAARMEQMSDYWRDKITRNVSRDTSNNALLTQAGYSVLRFLESEVNGDLDGVVDRVVQTVRGPKGDSNNRL